ncbi:alpha/beta hydrolase [Simiduia curdlanivorans]|uniref:Esterase/lipase family protein n=1 Tax=Simiduia curdlanivorans TaxID=1492769 RepID=A0ABV8V5B2_9GAMM|nr:alpha/beta hydrolase [Simiduia curdlanivorans]MDN3640747.1 alpha/beta hydrolase [Simiduia curdlanivorans]
MRWCYFFSVMLLVGCTSSALYVPDAQPLDSSRLSSPNKTVSIAGLSSCTDAVDASIRIDSHSPITVLVHGCNGSAGRFRSLAQLYAFHGQQAICFSYDDRKSLVSNAEQLATALNELTQVMDNNSISIVGHSMGGLIARKALEETYTKSGDVNNKTLDLVTVSAPVSGIAVAGQCGIEPLHWLSIGIVPGICWLVTGDNWFEITSSSDFIRNPKPLVPSVERYLKIVTNEKDACRRADADGKCIESDYVFDLAEQYHPKIDSDVNTTGVQVDAGHVEIVGNKNLVPRKLLAILQAHGVLSTTPPERAEAFEQLLAELY